MGHAQNALELVYELRASAMTEIAEKMSTALGDAGGAKATAAIAKQMQKLLAADVLYAAVVRPEINRVLEDNGVEGSDVPKSVFLPEGTKWLDESAVCSAWGGVSGSSGAASPGVHGLGLSRVSINGTELARRSDHGVSAEETPEVEVSVENQGESTENGIAVSVTVEGTTKAASTASGPAKRRSVTIPLTPAPSGEVTLEIKVEPVPGEQLSTTTKPATRSPSNRGWRDADRLPRPGRHLHRGRAARGGAGGEFEPLRTATIHDAILAVERGEADRALVPFENSIEGSVRGTLDTLAFEPER